MKRNRKWHNFSVRLGLFWLILFFFLTSCSSKDDTDVIRQLVKQGAIFAEKHDIRGLMKLTSEDFLAMPGQHDHRGVRRILWMAFRHYGEFKVMYPNPSVDLEPSGLTAFATIYFMIVKKDLSFPKLKELYKDPQGWLEEAGENVDLYRLKLELLKKNSDWLVRQAHLELFRGLGFGEYKKKESDLLLTHLKNIIEKSSGSNPSSKLIWVPFLNKHGKKLKYNLMIL